MVSTCLIRKLGRNEGVEDLYIRWEVSFLDVYDLSTIEPCAI